MFFMVIEMTIGNRVPAASEIEGLDTPEMGAMGYPDFVLTPGPESAAALNLFTGPGHAPVMARRERGI